MSRLALIGVAICSRQIGLHAYHISGDHCAHAKAGVAKGVSSTLPFPANTLAPSDILDGLHDILVTSRHFNIELFRPGGSTSVSGTARGCARAADRSFTVTAARAGIGARQRQWQSVPSDAHASNTPDLFESGNSA